MSREDQDAFALASHQKACAAIAAGHFKAETTPFEVVSHLPDANGAVRVARRLVETDEGPRPDSSAESLAKAAPGVRRARQCHGRQQLADVRRRGRRDPGVRPHPARINLQPLARFVSFAVAGVPPEVMGIGPVAAIPKVLERGGIAQDALDWIELNEAFAAQSLAVMRELKLDPTKVNPLGGAIALGHPLGATGAIRTATLVHGLRRTGGKHGLVTMCIGTGMGAAGLFEAL